MVKKVFAHSEENGLTIAEFDGKHYAILPLKKKLMRPHFAHVVGAGFQVTGGGNNGDDDSSSGDSGDSSSGDTSSHSNSGPSKG